jgi:hypothetical protein
MLNQVIEKYRVAMPDQAHFKKEQKNAFEKFRKKIEPWRLIDRNCYVALGSDSDSGEWSVVFEEGFWLVFIGERGERSHVSIFTSIWDALTYAGYRATFGRGIDHAFPELRPGLDGS